MGGGRNDVQRVRQIVRSLRFGCDTRARENRRESVIAENACYTIGRREIGHNYKPLNPRRFASRDTHSSNLWNTETRAALSLHAA